MLPLLAAAATFLCADYPDKPLFIVDYDKCTNVLLSTVRVPDPRRATVRDVTIRIEAGVPRSRERHRLSDVRVRVNCADLSVTSLSAVDFDRAGRVVRRDERKGLRLPKLTDPLQIKAIRAVCRTPPTKSARGGAG